MNGRWTRSQPRPPRTLCLAPASRAAHSPPTQKGSAVPTGKVKWYDAEKGFGFLSREDGRRRLRPLLRRCPRASPRSRPAPGSSSASSRAARATRPTRCASSTRPRRWRRTSARTAQEARGHGRHRRGPDPAARGRRAGLPRTGATPRPRRPSRPPSCCADWPTSWSSSPSRSGAPASGAAGRLTGTLHEHERGPQHHQRRPAPRARARGHVSPISGSAMPMKPPRPRTAGAASPSARTRRFGGARGRRAGPSRRGTSLPIACATPAVRPRATAGISP